MGAVSLAQGKAALAGYAGTADDTAIGEDLAAAESQCAKLCGWPVSDGGSPRSFESATYTVYGTMDLGEPRRLLLPVPPSAVTSVHVTTAETYDSSSLLASTQYAIDNSAGFGLYALNGQSWTTAPRGNKVVCTAGWAEGSAPDDVRAAVLAMLKHRWSILRVAQGRPQVSQQGSSTARDALVAVPALVRQMLQASEAWTWRTS